MFKYNIFKKYFFVEYSKIILNITLSFLALGIIFNLIEDFSLIINIDFLNLGLLKLFLNALFICLSISGN